MPPVHRKPHAKNRQSDVTFRYPRNVTLEAAIKRDMPNASDAEVRFQALWMVQKQEVGNPQYWQVLRGSVIAALEEHLRDRSNLAPDIAACLQEALHVVNQGEMSPLTTPRRTKLGRGNTARLVKQRQIEAAVDYVVAVERNLISDKSSRLTLARAYEVSREQVSRWIGSAGTIAQRNSRFDARWSEFAKRGNKLGTGMGWKQVAKTVSKTMRWRAQDYRDARRTRRK